MNDEVLWKWPSRTGMQRLLLTSNFLAKNHSNYMEKRLAASIGEDPKDVEYCCYIICYLFQSLKKNRQVYYEYYC